MCRVRRLNVAQIYTRVQWATRINATQSTQFNTMTSSSSSTSWVFLDSPLPLLSSSRLLSSSAIILFSFLYLFIRSTLTSQCRNAFSLWGGETCVRMRLHHRKREGIKLTYAILNSFVSHYYDAQCTCTCTHTNIEHSPTLCFLLFLDQARYENSIRDHRTNDFWSSAERTCVPVHSKRNASFGTQFFKRKWRNAEMLQLRELNSCRCQSLVNPLSSRVDADVMKLQEVSFVKTLFKSQMAMPNTSAGQKFCSFEDWQDWIFRIPSVQSY